MEVLSNLSLPFVFEYPATPCAPLLLLSLLCLASVVQFFFFNPLAHLPFHILTIWWRQQLEEPRLVWYIYFADSLSQWEVGLKLVGELGPKWLLETGQSPFLLGLPALSRFKSSFAYLGEKVDRSLERIKSGLNLGGSIPVGQD